MRILDLEPFSRFRGQRDVKVLRHRDANFDLWALRDFGRCADLRPRNGGNREHIQTFDEYQSAQGWDVFGTAKCVISFIAERRKYAKFVGVWEVLSKRSDARGHYSYRTREMPGFESLERRLVVHWGLGTRSWAQWLHKQGNKSVSELLPPDYVEDFRGFYDFALCYDDLVRMINNPESNREWHRMLSSVSGVYLVLDQVTGEQYVGSAYGVGGIWSRWRNYVKDPSGGNKRLQVLLRRHVDRHKRFQFSILRVLEPGLQKDAVIEQEIWAKRKLGSRAFGLNGN